jgi:glyoxylase-like metal-dependent hydrolase (beta-lactamase superfamily II)
MRWVALAIAVSALPSVRAQTALPSLRAQTAPVQAGVTITFLANEGVMLSSGGKKVLIDALFLKYETGYAVPADSTLSALAKARPPFDSVDLILVTHRHGDHFHPVPLISSTTLGPGSSPRVRSSTA